MRILVYVSLAISLLYNIALALAYAYSDYSSDFIMWFLNPYLAIIFFVALGISLPDWIAVATAHVLISFFSVSIVFLLLVSGRAIFRGVAAVLRKRRSRS